MRPGKGMQLAWAALLVWTALLPMMLWQGPAAWRRWQVVSKPLRTLMIPVCTETRFHVHSD